MTTNQAREDFNLAGATPRKTAALLIDLPLSSYYEMNPDDQKAYLDAMTKTISTLRQSHINICWITMKDKNHLYAPQDGKDDACSMDEMREMGLAGFGEETKPDTLKSARQIMHEQQSSRFLQQSGPLQSETVFSKFFMSGFITPDQYINNPERYTELRGQFRKDIDLTFPAEGDSLNDHLQAMGVTDLVLMGAFADHCITENALDAHLHGYDVTVISDRIVGWDNDNPSLMVWNGTNYENIIRDRIADRIAERNLDTDAASIRYKPFSAYAADLAPAPEQVQPQKLPSQGIKV